MSGGTMDAAKSSRRRLAVLGGAKRGGTMTGDIIYQPTPEQIASTQLTRFMNHCARSAGCVFADYADFERWAVEDCVRFWRCFLLWSNMAFRGSMRPTVPTRGKYANPQAVDDAVFFPNLKVNYTETLLQDIWLASRPAIAAYHHDAPAEFLTRGELRKRVEHTAWRYYQVGVRPGDRVVAIARNNIDTVVAALATAAIGAVFSSCSTDMGVHSIVDRFVPLEPKLLVAHVDSQPWDTGVPLETKVRDVAFQIESLESTIHLGSSFIDDGGKPSQEQLSGYEPMGFNDPLFILFSSGTTGAPKAIVHSIGGTLLEHLKEHQLHCDISEKDTLFYHTTPGWMMWNWQLSALASGARIVLYDGPITHPKRLWHIVENARVTVFGTSPGYLQMCAAADYAPNQRLDLSALRSVLSTGSILSPDMFDWVVENVKHLPVQSISGGTDVLGCLVLGNPNLPVRRGEIQCRSLGLDVQAVYRHSEPVGELVVANPFPSRPVGLWGDDD